MKLLSDVWNWEPLQGKKTYLAVFLAIVVTGAKALGYIDQTTYNEVMAILGALGLAAVRSAL